MRTVAKPAASKPLPPSTAAHQLRLAFNSIQLQALSPGERAKAITRLANLLMQAARVAVKGDDDGQH